MSDIKFWVKTIEMTEAAEVTALTVIASQETLDVIAALVGHEVTAVPAAHDYREARLPEPDASHLFRACGGLNGLDPRHVHTTEIYDRLTQVYYGLLGE